MWLSGARMAALRIGDEPLAPAAVAAAARGGPLTAIARARGPRAHGRAATPPPWRSPTRREVYGRTTGVGANRDVSVHGDLRAHTVRLLRSHAGGLGDPLPDEVVRATLLVRLAQMAPGAGGSRPEVADALAALLGEAALPTLRDLGGHRHGRPHRARPARARAGRRAPARDRARRRAPADVARTPRRSRSPRWPGPTCGSCSTPRSAWPPSPSTPCAATGRRSPQPLAAARPLSGLAAVVGPHARAHPSAARPRRACRTRSGCAACRRWRARFHEALEALHGILAVEINAAAENPFFADGEALHHGGFHAAPCALALDAVRLAVVSFAGLSAARLSHLMAPRLTGLSPFLAVDEPGASGMLIAEYLAADALGRLRAEAMPAVLGAASISRGLEEHASFAWQAAAQTRRTVDHLRTVLALEWVAAERALRMGTAEVPAPLRPARELLRGLDPSLEDRPIGEDATAAAAALGPLAAVAEARALRQPDADKVPKPQKLTLRYCTSR